MLSTNEFADAVRKVPIVAVDFVVENSAGKILLGKRNDNPAKGRYFTFGGAILKDETLEKAIESDADYIGREKAEEIYKKIKL